MNRHVSDGLFVIATYASVLVSHPGQATGSSGARTRSRISSPSSATPSTINVANPTNTIPTSSFKSFMVYRDATGPSVTNGSASEPLKFTVPLPGRYWPENRALVPTRTTSSAWLTPVVYQQHRSPGIWSLKGLYLR
jgi:hypothetical protein